MKAYAVIKKHSHGEILLQVNLSGSGRAHLDKLLAGLATTLKGDYTEIRYGDHNPQFLTRAKLSKNQLALTTTVGGNYAK